MFLQNKIIIMLFFCVVSAFAGTGQLVWKNKRCNIEATFIPQFKAVTIEKNGKFFSLRYDMLVHVYCPTKEDYLNLKIESIAPIKVDSHLYRREVKKIAPPVGNQGIDMRGAVLLDAITFENCKAFQGIKNKKTSFNVVSDGACHVDVSAPGIHDGFDLKVNKERGVFYFYINNANVYKS